VASNAKAIQSGQRRKKIRKSRLGAVGGKTGAGRIRKKKDSHRIPDSSCSQAEISEITERGDMVQKGPSSRGTERGVKKEGTSTTIHKGRARPVEGVAKKVILTILGGRSLLEAHSDTWRFFRGGE